jgi:hypothetical protein
VAFTSDNLRSNAGLAPGWGSYTSQSHALSRLSAWAAPGTVEIWLARPCHAGAEGYGWRQAEGRRRLGDLQPYL